MSGSLEFLWYILRTVQFSVENLIFTSDWQQLRFESGRKLSCFLYESLPVLMFLLMFTYGFILSVLLRDRCSNAMVDNVFLDFHLPSFCYLWDYNGRFVTTFKLSTNMNCFTPWRPENIQWNDIALLHLKSWKARIKTFSNTHRAPFILHVSSLIHFLTGNRHDSWSMQ